MDVCDYQGGVMANTNCLKGMRCPECGNEDYFQILVNQIYDVSDDGADDGGRDVDWDESNWCWCNDCNEHGTVGYFQTDEPEKEATDGRSKK